MNKAPKDHTQWSFSQHCLHMEVLLHCERSEEPNESDRAELRGQVSLCESHAVVSGRWRLLKLSETSEMAPPLLLAMSCLKIELPVW